MDTVVTVTGHPFLVLEPSSTDAVTANRSPLPLLLFSLSTPAYLALCLPCAATVFAIPHSPTTPPRRPLALRAPPVTRSRSLTPAPGDQSSCPTPVSFAQSLLVPITLTQSHGWATFSSMRPHIGAHLAGQLMGDIPPGWLRGQGFSTCEVCQRVLSLRSNGRCPSCFHTLTFCSRPTPPASHPLAEGLPAFGRVYSGKLVRSSVPTGARDSWSRCLIISLAVIIAHRDVWSWTDLLTLLAPVLAAPSRSGRRRRCLDWISAIRADLWAPVSGKSGKQHSHPGLLHPGPPTEDRVNMNSLRRIAARAAPTAEVDQVRKALHSCPSTSGAGRSGLRPWHIRDATRPASADLLLRLLSEVANLLLQGELRELVRPYVCGHQSWPNWSLRPIGIGETIRRLTSKVAVDLITDRARSVVWASRRRMGAKLPSMSRASGFTAIARSRTRLPSR